MASHDENLAKTGATFRHCRGSCGGRLRVRNLIEGAARKRMSCAQVEKTIFGMILDVVGGSEGRNGDTGGPFCGCESKTRIEDVEGEPAEGRRAVDGAEDCFRERAKRMRSTRREAQVEKGRRGLSRRVGERSEGESQGVSRGRARMSVKYDEVPHKGRDPRNVEMF